MKFSEIIKQANDLLQQRGRLSYRTLRMEFDLNDEQLDVLKEQLIGIEALAVDQDGKMLVPCLASSLAVYWGERCPRRGTYADAPV